MVSYSTWDGRGCVEKYLVRNVLSSLFEKFYVEYKNNDFLQL